MKRFVLNVARTRKRRRFLPDDMFEIYQMIWQRFVASQNGDYTQFSTRPPWTFPQRLHIPRERKSVVKFEGYLAVYQVVKGRRKGRRGRYHDHALPRLTKAKNSPRKHPAPTNISQASSALHGDPRL